jgi:hypothetical protein
VVDLAPSKNVIAHVDSVTEAVASQRLVSASNAEEQKLARVALAGTMLYGYNVVSYGLLAPSQLPLASIEVDSGAVERLADEGRASETVKDAALVSLEKSCMGLALAMAMNRMTVKSIFTVH